jgi:hypothetical protein
LIQSRRWLEAHDALEALRGEAEEGSPLRSCLQALTQQLLALDHLGRGNALECFNVWSRARGTVKKLDDWVAGVGVGPWSEALMGFYTADVNLADRVKQQLEGGIAAGAEHIDMGPLPPLTTWPVPALTPELEARLADSAE